MPLNQFCVRTGSPQKSHHIQKPQSPNERCILKHLQATMCQKILSHAKSLVPGMVEAKLTIFFASVTLFWKHWHGKIKVTSYLNYIYIWVLSLHISYFLVLLCIEVFPTVKIMNINTALGNEHYVTLPYKHSKEQIITQRVIVCLGCFCSHLRGDVDGGYENNYAPLLLLQAIGCLVPHNYLPLTYLESAFATNELFT